MRAIVHRAAERGGGEYGWLATRYSFSFADWRQPSRMGFGALRVLNDDRIAPSSGFPPHAHRDMEIATIVMEGAVTHEDSAGNRGSVPAGDVQVMSAGTGIVHSEWNRSPDEPLELFQIWITPRKAGGTPRYAQASLGADRAVPGLLPLVEPDTAEEKSGATLTIRQDAWLSLAAIDAGHPIEYALHRDGSVLYAFVIDGEAAVGRTRLSARDAVALSATSTVLLESSSLARVLLIEVPGEHGGRR